MVNITSFLTASTTASDNEQVNGIGINGTNPVSNFDNAMRENWAILRRDLDNGMVLTSKSGNYTAVADDNNAVIRFSAAATLTLTAAATLGTGWHVWVMADGGAVVIDPNSTETINGATTITIPDGWASLIICNGTSFFCQDPVDPAALVTLTSTQTLANKTLTAPSGEFLRGYINGLVLSNNATDATNDIDVATGSASSDGATPVLMTLASALTKRLDALWAVGTGNGGLDTGTIANTTYHVWLIQRSDTGVVDALFSASASSPTMPTNYDRKRRIGSIIRESGAIRAFSQLGDEFLWLTPDLSWNVTNPGTSTVNRTVKVPSGFAFRAMLNILLFDTGSLASTTAALVTSISQNDTAATATNFSIVAVIGSSTSDPYGASSYLEVRTDNLARVRTNVSASGSATTFRCMTMGYIDERGRT